MKTLLAAVVCLPLTGCALVPSSARVELEHVSHPLAGWPVGPCNEEDGLSQVNALLKWKKGGAYLEQGFGYNLEGRNGGGFLGPKLTYTGRVGYEFKFNRSN